MALDARMITLVREARGWNQSEFAVRLGLTQGYISKLESGLSTPEDDLVSRMSDQLGCPPELLRYEAPATAIEVTCLHHRRRASTMSAGTKKRIEALAKLTSITVQRLLTGVDLQHRATIERAPDDDSLDPVAAAAFTRSNLDLGSGPVANVVRSVESAGVMIVRRALGTPAQDAVSAQSDSNKAASMMIVNTGLPADRLRFTVAHELGHIVLHRTPTDSQEAEANQFASAFLAPADEITPELDGLARRDMGRLMKLKSRWGLSVAALIRRAHDLEIIDADAYRDYEIQLSRLGWRNGEPGHVEPEHPALLGRVIELRRSQKHLDDAALARIALMTEPAFRRHYLPRDASPTMTLNADEN